MSREHFHASRTQKKVVPDHDYLPRVNANSEIVHSLTAVTSEILVYNSNSKPNQSPPSVVGTLSMFLQKKWALSSRANPKQTGESHTVGNPTVFAGAARFRRSRRERKRGAPRAEGATSATRHSPRPPMQSACNLPLKLPSKPPSARCNNTFPTSRSLPSTPRRTSPKPRTQRESMAPETSPP